MFLTKAGLECPARSSKAPVDSGYKSLAENLIQFQMHGCMSPDLDIKRLDDGDGIEATMMNHHACWHKACRVKFSQTKLELLERRLAGEKNKESLPMQTRSSHESVKSVELNEDRSFFCDEPAGSASLHNASTYDIDRKVRRCTLELEELCCFTSFSRIHRMRYRLVFLWKMKKDSLENLESFS